MKVLDRDDQGALRDRARGLISALRHSAIMAPDALGALDLAIQHSPGLAPADA